MRDSGTDVKVTNGFIFLDEVEDRRGSVDTGGRSRAAAISATGRT